MTTGMRLLFRTLLCLVVVGITTSSAFACVCGAGPLQTRLRKAGAVFVGQAVEAADYERLSTNPSLVQNLVAGEDQQILLVEKAWKGVGRKYVAVTFDEFPASSSCPTLYFFSQEKKYLVFAYGKKLQVKRVCSDSWEIPSNPTSPGYEQMNQFVRKLDSNWFRLRARLRLFF